MSAFIEVQGPVRSIETFHDVSLQQGNVSRVLARWEKNENDVGTEQ